LFVPPDVGWPKEERLMSLRLFLLAIIALKVLRAFYFCVVNVQRKRFSEETIAYHVACALARSEDGGVSVEDRGAPSV
jgi:hypothetical protein